MNVAGALTFKQNSHISREDAIILWTEFWMFMDQTLLPEPAIPGFSRLPRFPFIQIHNGLPEMWFLCQAPKHNIEAFCIFLNAAWQNWPDPRCAPIARNRITPVTNPWTELNNILTNDAADNLSGLTHLILEPRLDDDAISLPDPPEWNPDDLCRLAFEDRQTPSRIPLREHFQ